MGTTLYSDQSTPIAGAVVSAVATNVENLFCVNPSTTDTIYVQLFTLLVQPTAADVPVYWLPVRPLETVNLSPPGPVGGAVAGRKLGAFGVWFSSTPDTYTAGPLASFWATYRES